MHIHNCKLVATSAQFVKFQIASELKRVCFTDKQKTRQARTNSVKRSGAIAKERNETTQYSVEL